MDDVRQRIFSRLIIDPSGCLLWTGARSEGYGSVRIGNRSERVHRLMYEWFVGPIPKGLQIDHLCRVRHCAAPDHLEIVTQQQNILRGASPSARASQRTHCIHGHEFDLLNTYHWGRKRSCRACDRERHRRYRSDHDG